MIKIECYIYDGYLSKKNKWGTIFLETTKKDFVEWMIHNYGDKKQLYYDSNNESIQIKLNDFEDFIVYLSDQKLSHYAEVLESFDRVILKK